MVKRSGWSGHKDQKDAGGEDSRYSLRFDSGLARQSKYEHIAAPLCPLYCGLFYGNITLQLPLNPSPLA